MTDDITEANENLLVAANEAGLKPTTELRISELEDRKEELESARDDVENEIMNLQARTIKLKAQVMDYDEAIEDVKKVMCKRLGVPYQAPAVQSNYTETAPASSGTVNSSKSDVRITVVEEDDVGHIPDALERREIRRAEAKAKGIDTAEGAKKRLKLEENAGGAMNEVLVGGKPAMTQTAHLTKKGDNIVRDNTHLYRG